ncbi:Beta-hydroxyacyl-(Acyl-carrier-protein) dehydratase FabA/FabZ [Crenothrix polyspora]|uniref:Beta-hydroxyacyl-(Acyl-carrier-protein) dehydratase FabA/FabZ n=1 Tax=Crenothrix polyspora TaxID=360316 RepID=A0A1R4H5V9_9GAMM|nr:hotdog family protein [Crenothrix polyspora]SJM91569.1 Beta-hydroxyacyl-(Acyl-carrier-protein) dehydratase FabA/FabZ [Crenothrix polyspora]
MIDYSDIAALIPHSGRMVLLDRIIDFDGHTLSAELIVRDDGLFGDKHSVPAWVGIEYMAQAIAAYAGIQSKLAGEPIKLGFLLGTRRYISNIANFAVGTILTIQVKNIIQDDKLGVFDCKIYGADIEISANLNVYQPPIETKLATTP